MWKNVKNTLCNIRGITLVELLAVITLSSFLLLFSTGYLVSAMKTYDKISVENALRDEGDLIMAMLIRDFYKIETVSLNTTPDCPTTGCPPHIIYACKADPTQVTALGFQNAHIYTEDGRYQITNKNIVLNTDYSITKIKTPNPLRDAAPNITFTIHFSLTHLLKNSTRSFTSTVNLVNTGVEGSKCIN